MKILYYCHTGVHTALIGAGIHLGHLSKERIPAKKEVYQLPYFNSLRSSEIGKPLYIGKDPCGHEVYVFGVAHEKEVFTRAIKDILDIYKISPREYKIVDLLKCNNRLISLGGWFSSVLGWRPLGRVVVFYGITTVYDKIVAEVSRVLDFTSQLVDNVDECRF